MAELTLGKKLLKNQVARFVLSAGMGFLVDIASFYVLYNFLLSNLSYHLLFFDLDKNSLSLAMSFSLGVVVNFLITRYFVFNQSVSSPSKQFLRFVSVAVIGYYANLGMLKIFVHVFNMYPPYARIAAALSLFFASFFVHKFFSFSLSLRHQTPGKQKK